MQGNLGTESLTGLLQDGRATGELGDHSIGVECTLDLRLVSHVVFANSVINNAEYTHELETSTRSRVMGCHLESRVSLCRTSQVVQGGYVSNPVCSNLATDWVSHEVMRWSHRDDDIRYRVSSK